MFDLMSSCNLNLKEVLLDSTFKLYISCKLLSTRKSPHIFYPKFTLDFVRNE